MPNDTAIMESDLQHGDLFSEHQIMLPLAVSIMLTIAVYFTFAYFYNSEEAAALSARFLNNGFCLLIISVFFVSTLYAALHYLGLRIERYHIDLLAHEANDRPYFYALNCFLTGRQNDNADRFYKTVERWRTKTQSSADIADVSDHLLFLREQQHQHNLAPLNFAVWVMPLLGFVGTVVGITQAIGGLEEAVGAAGSPTGGGLENVLGGLRFAFDTTFMGLVLVIPTMLYILALRIKAHKLNMRYHRTLLNQWLQTPKTDV